VSGRSALDRRMRWSAGAAYLGVALCMTGAVGHHLTGRGEWFALWFPGFPAALVSMVYAQVFGLRCPWCRENLASLAFQRGLLSFDQRVLCCPYCRHDLDEEIEPEADGRV
jgi:hypothetical protein